MNDRYFGRVANTIDEFSVVVNKGKSDKVEVNDKFLIVGLGEVIVDPDTKEELERLEIVRGKAKITHLQEKISTLCSYEHEKSSDQKEIKRVTLRRDDGLSRLLGSKNIIDTETITPGKQQLKELNESEVGDLIIKL